MKLKFDSLLKSRENYVGGVISYEQITGVSDFDSPSSFSIYREGIYTKGGVHFSGINKVFIRSYLKELK